MRVIPIKGSYDKQVLKGQVFIIKDFFSYVLAYEEALFLMNNVINEISSLANNLFLIELYYPCSLVDSYEVILEVNHLFNKSILSKKIRDAYKEKVNVGQLHLIETILKKTIKEGYKKSPFLSKIKPIIEHMFEGALVEGRRSILKSIAKHQIEYFVVLNNFQQNLLYKLDKNIKGFFIRNDIAENDFVCAKDMHIPIIQTKIRFKDFDKIILDGNKNLLIIEPQNNHIIPSYTKEAPYEQSQIHLYLAMYDLNKRFDIHESWYKGVYLYATYMLITKWHMFSIEEVTDSFCAFFKRMQNKKVFIELPNIKDDRQLMYDPEFRTEIDLFTIDHVSVNNWFEGLINSINIMKPNVSIIIPNTNSWTDASYFNEEMEMFNFKLHDIETKADIGVTIETEAALQYCEDFEKMKPIVFKLKELTYEYTDQYDIEKIHKKDLNFLIDDLKEAHFIYRVKQPKVHIISDVPESMFRKFINYGFRGFVINYENLEAVSKIMQNWEETRGQFRKSKLKASNDIQNNE